MNKELKNGLSLSLLVFVFLVAIFFLQERGLASDQKATIIKSKVESKEDKKSRGFPTSLQTHSNQESVYLIGGQGIGLVNNGDVWKSIDGVNWSSDVSSSPLPGMHNHEAIFFNDKFWVVGGYDDSVFSGIWAEIPSDKIYSSQDGINWTPVDANPLTSAPDVPWGNRVNHELVVFNKKMYLLGGSSFFSTDITDIDAKFSVVTHNDVWSTSDGISWERVDSDPTTLVIDDAPWKSRQEFSSVVFDNKLWIMGGGSISYNPYFTYEPLNDVWYTSDGINWENAGFANWLPRVNFSTVSFDNKIWLFGGFVPGPVYQNYNDAWYTTDGINWIQSSSYVIPNSQFISIDDAYVLNNQINIISSSSPVPAPPGPARDQKIYITTDGLNFGLITTNPPWVYAGAGGWGRSEFALLVK